jgi:hypothetical protein
MAGKETILLKITERLWLLLEMTFVLSLEILVNLKAILLILAMLPKSFACNAS